MQMTTATLRTPEVAERLGVSNREVIRLLDTGELPRQVDDDGNLVVPVDAVDEYAARTS
jgi:excisionase family DNA binding protein